jgi:hypothetical protein
VIRLFSLFFSVVCIAAFIWFGATVDLGERTLFGHLRAIASSKEAGDLWDGAKAKVSDFVGIDAAKRAEAAKEAAKKAAKDVTKSYIERGGTRTLFGPQGAPQERLTERDQKQMNEKMQRLASDSGSKTASRTATPKANPGVQGRSPPRESEKARARESKPN